MDFTLSDDLDIAAAKASYDDHGFARLDRLVPMDQMAALITAMSGAHAWAMFYDNGKGEERLDPARMMSMTDRSRRELSNSIYQQALDSGAFVHQRLEIDRLRRDESDVESVVYDFHAFLQSDTVRSLITEVTGDDSWSELSVDAYHMSPNQFTGARTGLDGDAGRKIGYEVGCSSAVWRSDLGGQLAFPDMAGDLTPALTPSYNSLTLWRADKTYAVQPVAPYSKYVRLTVAGWCR